MRQTAVVLKPYLTAKRVSDRQTMRIYLGQVWMGHQPGRRATFSSGGPGRPVTAIEFEAVDSFSYRFQEGDRPRRVDFTTFTVR